MDNLLANIRCYMPDGDLQEKLNKATADPCLNDSLNLVICAVGKVGQGPACVCQDLLVCGVNEALQGRKSRLRLQRGPNHIYQGHQTGSSMCFTSSYN